jgi:alanine racemase
VIGSLHVSTAALRHNAETLRALVRPAKTAFVVKSNAYGHGLVETALAIESLAARICVYGVEEAVELRDGGVTAPILILGPVPPGALDDAHAAGAEVALWDVHGYAQRLAAVARKRHARFPVHVKINTGVNRFGLEPGEALDAIEEYLRVPELELAGVFSHLAAAEEIDSPYTTLQTQRFAEVMTQAQPLFAQREAAPIAHIAASAAAMLWPQTRLDMVRIGIALYGLWPSPQTRDAMSGAGVTLEPALSYTSELAATREVAAGTPIGYGCAFHAPRTMRIGVLPLGYADGIPRAFSNIGGFAVAGARCPIVGRVCMNVTLLDLTGAPHAHAGTAVTLIGTDGDASISADDWAVWAGTINYEIVTRLPSELPRAFETQGAPDTL